MPSFYNSLSGRASSGRTKPVVNRAVNRVSGGGNIIPPPTAGPVFGLDAKRFFGFSQKQPEVISPPPAPVVLPPSPQVTHSGIINPAKPKLLKDAPVSINPWANPNTPVFGPITVGDAWKMSGNLEDTGYDKNPITNRYELESMPTEDMLDKLGLDPVEAQEYLDIAPTIGALAKNTGGGGGNGDVDDVDLDPGGAEVVELTPIDRKWYEDAASQYATTQGAYAKGWEDLTSKYGENFNKMISDMEAGYGQNLENLNRLKGETLGEQDKELALALEMAQREGQSQYRRQAEMNAAMGGGLGGGFLSGQNQALLDLTGQQLGARQAHQQQRAALLQDYADREMGLGEEYTRARTAAQGRYGEFSTQAGIQKTMGELQHRMHWLDEMINKAEKAKDRELVRELQEQREDTEIQIADISAQAAGTGAAYAAGLNPATGLPLVIRSYADLAKHNQYYGK